MEEAMEKSASTYEQIIDEKPGYINVKVKDQSGNTMYFRIKRSTALKKLMDAFCEKQSAIFVFLYDGKKLSPKHTPELVAMEDGDEIDAMLPQTGGG